MKMCKIKKMKRAAAWMLMSAMVLVSLTGCGSGKEAKNQEGDAVSTKAETDESIESSTEESGREAAVEESGEIYPVRIVQPGTLPDGYEDGIAAVNAKLREDGYSIEVSVQRIPWDSYAEKLNLMLTTGEEFELLHIMQDVKNLSSIAAMGAIIPIDDILENYPGLKSRFTDTDWQGTVYNGEHYAVPCYWKSFDHAVSQIIVRTDVMNSVGYDEFPTDNVEELIDLMEKSQEYILEETGIKAYHWLHQNNDTAHWLHRTYDTYPFYVENSLGVVLVRQDGTIDSFYESEEFKKDADTYYEMYQKGLINPDILNMDSQVKIDQANLGAFLPSQTFDPSVGKVIMQNTDLTGVTSDWTEMCPDKPEMIYTYSQNLNAVSSTAENPEAAIQFLDWLYASPENHDLFHYGVEGVHFADAGEGLLARTDEMKNANGDALYYMDTWMTGYLPYMRVDEAVATDEYLAYNVYKSDNYVISPVAGFLFDATNVTTELTNLQTEIIASIYPIKFGMVPYEENIGSAIEKLKAAGLDKYLEEYRTQFKEYLEANPDVLEIAKGSSK